jgi:hypothetical protein
MKNHLKVIDDTKDTYSDEYECKNCWHSFQVDIPKGVKLNRGCYHIICNGRIKPCHWIYYLSLSFLQQAYCLEGV